MTTPSPTNSVAPSSTVSAANIDQLLSLQNDQVVYRASDYSYNGLYNSIGGATIDGLAGFIQPLGSSVDMPFTVYGGGTPGVGVPGPYVFRFPVSINYLPTPTSSLGAIDYEQAPDCTLSITADGTITSTYPTTTYHYPDTTQVYGQTTVPAEYIKAVSSSLWPEPQEVLVSDWSVQTTASSTLLIGNDSVATTAGAYAIWAGGTTYSGTTSNGYSNRVQVARVTNGKIKGWLQGTPLPTSAPTVANTFVPESIPYSSLTGYLAIAGSGTALLNTAGATVYSSNQVWTASFGQDGVMGSWVRRTDLPVSLQGCYSTFITLPTADGTSTNDWLLVFSTDGVTIYAGQIDTTGAISSWNTIKSSTPFAVGQPTVLADGVSIVIMSDGAKYIATSSVSVDTNGTPVFAPWQEAHTYFSYQTGYSFNFLGVVGNSILVSGSYSGSANSFTTSLAVDSAASNLSDNVVPQGCQNIPYQITNHIWSFSNNDGSYALFGISQGPPSTSPFTVTTVAAKAYEVNWVNVPIATTAQLVSGTSYHAVLQVPNKLPGIGLNIPVCTPYMTGNGNYPLTGVTSVQSNITVNAPSSSITTSPATGVYISTTPVSSLSVGRPALGAGFSPTGGSAVWVQGGTPYIIYYTGVSGNSITGVVSLRAATTATGDTITPSWSTVPLSTFATPSVQPAMTPLQMTTGTILPGGNAGPLQAFIENPSSAAPTRVSYFYFGSSDHTLYAAGEWEANERSFSALEYDGNGVITDITEVY